MQKIPTLLRRDPENPRTVLPEVTPGCEWVFAGEGVARRKYDGTCVMLDEQGQWWNRREIRAGKEVPADAIDLGEDPNTGKHMVYVPNSPAGFQAFLREAIANYRSDPRPGTYELCGPKIDTRAGQNPEGLDSYKLFRHDEAPTIDFIDWRTDLNDDYKDGYFGWLFVIITAMAYQYGWEGVVWHHPDGRMAKLKARDLL